MKRSTVIPVMPWGYTRSGRFALVTASLLLPIKQYLADFIDWIGGLGWWGPFVYRHCLRPRRVGHPGIAPDPRALASHTASSSRLLIVVSLGSLSTAVIAFWLGQKTLTGPRLDRARGLLKSKVPRFHRSGRAANGFKIVFLSTRSHPSSHTFVAGYAFRTDSRKFHPRTLHRLLDRNLPQGRVLHVYLRHDGHSAPFADLANGKCRRCTPAQTVLFWGGLVVTVIVTVLVTRAARQALRQAVPDADAKESQP